MHLVCVVTGYGIFLVYVATGFAMSGMCSGWTEHFGGMPVTGLVSLGMRGD